VRKKMEDTLLCIKGADGKNVVVEPQKNVKKKWRVLLTAYVNM
jgi:hypothetical protein